MENEENKKEDQPKEPVQVKETESQLQRADSIAARIEAANKRSEELIKRQEAVAARMSLSGRAVAAQETPKTPEQELEEQVDREVKESLEQFK